MPATINFKDVVNSVENIENKEIPYATSRGLNDTAFQSKKILSKTIPKNLDIKSKYISNAGVKIRKSNKNQIDVKASVFHDKDFMYDLETETDRKGEMAMTSKFRGRSARVGNPKRARVLLAGYKGPREAGKQGGKGKRKRGRTKFFRGEKNNFTFIGRRQKRKSSNKAIDNELIYAYTEIKHSNKVKDKLHFKKAVYGVVRHNGALNIARYLR